MRLPVSELVFGIIEDLAGLFHAFVGRMGVSGHDGSVVKEVYQTTRLLGKNDLLFSTLNGGCEVDIKSLLEFLTGLVTVLEKGILMGQQSTYDISELCFGDKALRFCSNKFLLELHNFRALWLLVLEFRNFVGDL